MTLKLANDHNQGVWIDTAAADKLCALKNPDALRVYLCAAVHGGEDTARRLGLSEEAFCAAAQELACARLATVAGEDESDKLSAVSYTHLDVYKRQSYLSAARTAAAWS